MKELGRFDPDNGGMFVDPPHDANLDHLRFLRKLAEQGRFGYLPYSIPRGDFFFRLSDNEIRKYSLQAQQPSIGIRKGEALLAHIARTGDY